MPRRRSITTDEAEQYELPKLHRDERDDGDVHRRAAGSSSKESLDGRRSRGNEQDEDADLELDDLQRPLLAADGVEKEGDESGEMVGKGSKIDQLIADTVPSTDDPTLPTLTLRVIILGSFFCILGAAASQIFFFKSNAPSFSIYFVILVTYPLGHILAEERFIPRGRWFLGMELNPGKFSIKEAILVSVIASSGAASAYATDILTILDLYFKMPLGPIASVTLLLTTQCIGFGLAGMLQSLLVNPPAMYWPATLVTVQLFTTLYPSTSSIPSAAAYTARQLVSKRMKVFTLIFIAVFLYQFLPFLLFPGLTSLSVLCLIDNRSWWLRTMGGAYEGLGVMNFSFDWSSIGTSGPLSTPYWALGNYFGGLMGIVWVVAPIMLFFNFCRDFPSPISPGLFTSSYERFNVSSVLNPDLSLNTEKWQEVQPMLLTPFFAVNYAFSFMALTAVLTHVWLWHRDEIKQAWSDRANLDDVHNTLMRAYKAVPNSWYTWMLGVNFAAAMLLVLMAPLQTPVWALLLSVVIATVFLVPVGVIAAVSNTQIGLNVLTEFICGLLLPGQPIANVTFKCFGYMAMSQALSLTNDLKLGWYTSIPPREMFACQILGTVLGALTNYITLISVISSKRPYLDGTLSDPTGQWTGRGAGVFYSASIIWGAVAPARFFAGKYVWLYAGFAMGVILPVVTYMGHKRWPGWKLNKVVWPIVCHGATQVPQYPSNIILTSALFTLAAHSWLAKKYPKLFGRYVYVVSSALDAGTSITALTIYLLFNVITQWEGPRWWGNPASDAEHCKAGT